ncbi:Inosose dehydratase [compost metagenome]
MGCKHVVTCESSNKTEDLGNNKIYITPLTDEQWHHVVDGLHKAGQYCKDIGMKLVYHFHGETVVETEAEIGRLMAMTDPELVYMLFDTGHAYYGGCDPLQLLQKHYDRIAYIHFKDVRKDVLEQHLKDGFRFREGVRRGVFTVPGDGCIDFKAICDELQRRNYEGWIIIEAEQNPEVANPLHYAEIARNYLTSITA